MTTNKRRFRLRDAIILTLATGAGCVPAREILPDLFEALRAIPRWAFSDPSALLALFTELPGNVREGGIISLVTLYYIQSLYGPFCLQPLIRSAGLGITVVQALYVLASPLLIAGSLAITGLRLDRPRPSLGTLIQQPGFAACTAATATFFCLPWSCVALKRDLPVALISVVVGTVWLMLVATQRWLDEPSWIDRAGRAIGVGWLALIPLYLGGRFWSY